MNIHDMEVINELHFRNRRVLIYGNMAYAVDTMHLLRENDIDVEAFIIDAWAYRSETIEGIPVKTVDEYIPNIEEYDVVIGFQNVEKSRAMLGLQLWLKTNVYMLWEPIAHVKWEHEWYLKHMPAFAEARNCLSDEISKKTLDALIEARETGNISPLVKLAMSDQYFNYITYEKYSSGEVFIDGGAFNGDTILAYNRFTAGKYKKIIAFEPESNNLEIIKNNINNVHDVCLIQKGLWDKDTTLNFTRDSSASRIEQVGTDLVEVTTIDSVMNGEQVSFIKMDIEGAEYEALCGAEKTIRKWMPKLAICVYHKCDDIFKMISFLNVIKDNDREYKFYLRHHTCAAYETVLYAIPDSNIGE